MPLGRVSFYLSTVYSTLYIKLRAISTLSIKKKKSSEGFKQDFFLHAVNSSVFIKIYQILPHLDQHICMYHTAIPNQSQGL